MSGEPVVIGVDVGTQGARVVAHDAAGELVGSESERFEGDWSGGEQDPEHWWRSVIASLGRLSRRLDGREISGISVTSTSGTVLPLDKDWRPLAPALMYSDRRAAAVADEIGAVFPGLGVNVSWGLPKIVWFERAYPELAGHIHAWRHPADFLIGRLTGAWGVTDQTTALKSGFDLVRNEWPVELFDELGIHADKMPLVGMTGEVAGRVIATAADETGLAAGTPVMLGMTDGCASQVASGAVRPGMWNSTIGTTLVIKGTTVERVVDPLGRIYNHRHPQGYWMPGAASNTGAAWISAWFPERDLGELDRLAATVIPTGGVTYPLVGTGERFPFVAAEATGFGFGGADEVVRYASALEGVAYLERMAFDLVEELSGERVEVVSTAGGGSAGETWLRIRANVLERPIRKVRHANAASGAAMIAASGCWYPGLIEAVEAMVELETVVEPDGLAGAYREGYGRFREELVRRGYCG
jgi:sugar (pentulose or hexulose) kinase